MMGETNHEIVLKLYDAFTQGDFQYVAERIAPQFTASQTTELPCAVYITDLQSI